MTTSSKLMLLVDDDAVFCQVMQRALLRRGYEVIACSNTANAEAHALDLQFNYAIVDLKIAQESGLSLIKRLKQINPCIEIIMLTGYSSISTAVEAIKLGALNYFCKPIEVDELLRAFSDEHALVELPSITTPSLGRLEWEHIQKTLNDCQGNISAAARALGMHRRTLQRKLQKHPVNN